MRFVRAFFDQAKPVGVICHGPWTLVEAEVVRGRTLMSWPSLKTDLIADLYDNLPEERSPRLKVEAPA